MPLRQRFETLLIYDPNRSPAAANVWISRPTPTEEQVLGKLVVVATIAGTDRVHLDLLNLIQEELRTAYYRSTDSKPERALEYALQQTNRRLHSVITDGVSQWVETANILIAAIWRDEVVMSSVGSIHGYLFRRNRMHDLLGDSDRTPVNPIRIFSHVIAGQLQSDDQLLFCTPSLLDYFSLEKLRRTLLDGSPAAAVHQWESTLLGVEQKSSFAAVIVQSVAAEIVTTAINRPVAQATLTQSAPQVSMEHLIAKEQATERLLSPSIWPAIRDVAVQLGHGVSTLTRQKILRKPPRRTLPGNIQNQAFTRTTPSFWSLVRRLIRRTGDELVHVITLLRPRRTKIPTPPPPAVLPTAMKRRWRPSLNQIISAFQRLSRQRQLLLGATVLLFIILAVSILPKHHATNNSVTVNSSESLSDHIAKANAAFIYGGEETARQELQAAQTIYNALPNRTTKDKTARQSAKTSLDQLRVKLSHQTTLPLPTTVANLSATALHMQPQQLYLAGAQLVAIDPNQTIVTATSLGTTNTTAVIANPTTDTGKVATGAVNTTSSIIFSTDRNGFLLLDTQKKTWKSMDAVWPAQNPRIQSIAVYQSRLYALDAAHNAIVRFSVGTSSLGSGVSWLKETAQVVAGRELQVDGSIFILQPKGIIEQYANGRKSSFTLASVDPALTDATRLVTDSTLTNIYLVDPSHDRIVVATKTGKLVDQYTSPAWTDLRDVAVNEKTKTAYALSGAIITSFTLLH